MTQKNRIIVFLAPYIFIVGGISTSNAEEIVLKQTHYAKSGIVLLGDIAQIKVEDNDRRIELENAPLFPAPVSGAQRIVRRQEILELLAFHGIKVTNIRVLGAQELLMFGGQSSAVNGAKISIPRSQRKAIESAVISAIQKHVGIHWRDSGPWNVSVDLTNQQIAGLLKLKGKVVLKGGREPWDSVQSFTFVNESPTVEPVEIKARLTRAKGMVVAIRTVARGSIIGPDDVELKFSDSGEVPEGVIQQIDVVVGKEAITALMPRQLVRERQLRKQRLVRRNQVVTVRAKNGGVLIKTFARAQDEGGLSDVIRIASIDSHEKYLARITGFQEVEVYGQGLSVDSQQKNRSTDIQLKPKRLDRLAWRERKNTHAASKYR